MKRIKIFPFQFAEKDLQTTENRRRETICRICKQPSRKKRRKRIISL